MDCASITEFLALDVTRKHTALDQLRIPNQTYRLMLERRLGSRFDYNPLMITQELFAAWLRCETEAFLKVVGTDGGPHEFLDWQQWMFDDYKHKSSVRLRANYRTDESGLATPSLNDLSIGKYPILIDGIVQTERIQARIHALERIPACGYRKSHPRFK